MVFLIIIVAISMAITMIRAVQGPSKYDRFLAMNSFGTQLMILIVLFAVKTDDMMLIDIALLYALINSVATIAFLDYIRKTDKPEQKSRTSRQGGMKA